jgi:predicted ArsR family transcriptional regulator
MPDRASDAPRRSFGISAVLLLRLQARVGQWVTVDELAAHFHLSAYTVRAHVEGLEASGDVAVQLVDGLIVSTRIAARGAEAGACA